MLDKRNKSLILSSVNKEKMYFSLQNAQQQMQQGQQIPLGLLLSGR